MQCSLFTSSVARSLPWWHSFSTTAHLNRALCQPQSQGEASVTLWPRQVHLLSAALAGSLWPCWFWGSSSCRGISSTACQHLNWRFHWYTNKVEGVFCAVLHQYWVCLSGCWVLLGGCRGVFPARPTCLNCHAIHHATPSLPCHSPACHTLDHSSSLDLFEFPICSWKCPLHAWFAAWVFLIQVGLRAAAQGPLNSAMPLCSLL